MANVIITTYDGFQSTPPRGRRLSGMIFMTVKNDFNPLRREGGDGLLQGGIHEPRRISIHSAARAETKFKGQFLNADSISIHSAARAETHSPGPQQTVFPYFNPLRREGGDLLLWQFFSRDYSFQSTPPRGRRRDAGGQGEKERHISIHSAARAETVSQERRYRNANNFNPLRREGGDIPALKPLIILPISIHSAARAETVLFNHKRDYVADFNPLRREGGDNRLMSGRS